MNENQIKVYDSTSSGPLNDPGHILDRAQDIEFSTVYPGGIFDTASFFIPCDPLGDLIIKHTDRLQIKNGLTTVWEGFVTSITLVIMPDRIGLDVQATGYWGLAYHRYKYNRWIDRRYTSSIYGTWAPGTAITGGNPKTTFNQDNQLLMTPKQTDWYYIDRAYLSWIANASSNVKRIVFDWELGTSAETNPVRAKYYNGATYSANLANMIDGDSFFTQAISLSTGDYLYIGMSEVAGLSGLRFDFGATVNSNAATLTVEYYGVDAAWHSLSITDGTKPASAPWAQDGTISWTAIDGMDQVSVNGSQKFFYVRISTSANLTANVVIADVFAVYAQSWRLFLYDLRNSAELWTTSTAGSGSQDITLTTSTDWLAFQLESDAAQKPTSNGVYGKITDLALVAESWDGTEKTAVDELLKDMVHALGSPFKDDSTYIAANTYDLLSTGFVADSLDDSLAENMIQVGSFSATDEPYSVGVLESDAIGDGNTSAVVYYEKVPALTGYDYAVRLDEQVLSGVELVLSSDLDTLYNNSFVRFRTENGKINWAYSADYAGLADATSTTKYMTRVLVVDGGQAATPALAGPVGAVYITAKKNLAYYMRSPLQLRGTIRTSDGNRVPVSTMRAGKRIKIENFGVDVGDVSGSGLTFLITATSYDDNSGVLSVTANVSDDLPTQLARVAARR